MARTRSRSELDEITNNVFKIEISELEAKRQAMKEMVVAIDEMEQIHARVVQLRDTLEDTGMTRAMIIKALALPPLSAKVLRSKTSHFQRTPPPLPESPNESHDQPDGF